MKGKIEMTARQTAEKVQRRRSATRKVIEKALIDKDIYRRDAIASKINMPVSTFNWKLRTGAWKLDEMCALFAALEMDRDAAAIVLGLEQGRC